jgi:hypothetical protein
MKRKFAMKPILAVPVLCVMSMMLMSASSPWTRDVSKVGWTLDHMEDNTTDGLLDMATQTVSGTTNGSFEIWRKTFLKDGHFVYDEKFLVSEGVPAHCEDGYALGLDPAHPDMCAKITNEGATHQEIDVAAHCDEGYTLGLDPAHPDMCAKANPLTYHTVCDKDCPTVTWSGDSRVVTDVEGYTRHHHWVTDDCSTDQADYTSHTTKACRWPQKIHGQWHYDDALPAHWGNWETGKCPSHSSGTCAEEYVPPVTHTETFGPITFKYDKSCDPNKCHRPTGSSLGVPSWAMSDFNAQNPEWLNQIDVNCRPVADPQTYDDKDEIPATYKTVADDPIYDDKDEIPATYDVWGCNEGYAIGADPDKPGDCAKWVPDSGWQWESEVYTINEPTPDGPKEPQCKPHGDIAPEEVWENVKGGFKTERLTHIYGNQELGADVTFTGPGICLPDPITGACGTSQLYFAVNIREPQTAMTLVIKGTEYKTVESIGADGATCHVLRAQVGGYPMFNGVVVVKPIDDGIWYMDKDGLTNWKHWSESNKNESNKNAPIYVYDSQSDAPSMCDGRINAGVRELGRFPGMIVEDVWLFLRANGVPNKEAEIWAKTTWYPLKFGEYAALPASFVPLMP